VLLVEEVGAGAFLVEGLPSAEAAAAAARRPCPAAGRTSRPAPSLMLGAVSRAAVPSRAPRIYLLRRRLRADAAAARALRWRLLARRAPHGVA